MKKNICNSLVIAAFGSFVLLAGCQKAVEDLKETSTSAEDCALAETAIASAFDVVDDIASTDGRMQKNGSTILPDGATVDFTDSVFTDGDGVELILNFGSTPLLCKDGKYRSGKINVTANKPYTELGCEVVALFNEGEPYMVGTPTDMMKLVCKITATRSGQEAVTIKIEDGKTESKLGSGEFFSTKVITRTSGSNQPGGLGDVYEVSGNGGGKNRNGESYETNITKTLVRKVQDGCANTFTVGVIELKNLKSGGILKIDFDPANDGACDKWVRITLPGGLKKDMDVE